MTPPDVPMPGITGGENANAVTSQALTDLGAAATFYDCLVEVARVVRPAAATPSRKDGSA